MFQIKYMVILILLDQTDFDNSSTKAFIRLSAESFSDLSNSPSSDSNKYDCSSSQIEYDFEGESDFDGEVKKRDEDEFPMIGSDRYLEFKDKSQIKLDDAVQLFGVDKSALDAPLLIPMTDNEPDTPISPSSFLPPNETVSVISSVRVYVSQPKA